MSTKDQFNANPWQNIPEVLKKKKRWVCWKYTERDGRRTKLPIDAATGCKARSNDPATWTSFAEAVQAVKRLSADGIGLMLGGGLFGVDLDHVIDRQTGEVEARALGIVGRLGSYTETSPSGEGLHILCFGALPEGARRRGNIEMYDSGRYFTVTGNVFGGYREISECTEKIKGLHREIFQAANLSEAQNAAQHQLTLSSSLSPKIGGEETIKKNSGLSHSFPRPISGEGPGRLGEQPAVNFAKGKNTARQDESTADNRSAPTDVCRANGERGKTPGLESADSKLLARIRRSAGGEKFDRLYSGNWQGDYQSQSEADLALSCILAFWTGRDAAKMDRLFRGSGLMRGKWDRNAGQGATYGRRTLEKAICETSAIYEPRSYPQVVNTVDNDKSHQKYTQDDEGNALRLLDAHGQDMHWSFVHGLWYVWTGRLWREDMTGRVYRMARSVTEQLERESLSRADDKSFMAHVRRSRNKQGIDSMLSMLRSMPGVPVLPQAMDPDGWLLTCANGTIELKTGKLREHRREDLATRIAPVMFDEDAKCPRWEDFLLEIMGGRDDMARYLQAAAGYSLTGCTREQCMFILYGSGANGKSTFLEILSAMLGGYCMNAQPDTLMAKRQAGAATADIARLSGARLVTTVEPDERCRLHEGAVKQLTGGDPVTCRFLYGREFEYTPAYKIWMATNHKPGVRGTDDGIWRRMRLIPFEVRIPEERQDRALAEKLKKEMPGILAWAVRGCLQWQKEGLISPEPVLAATNAYRGEMDQLAGFLEECVSPLPGAFMPSSDVYGAYRAWAEANGEYALGHRTFSIKLQERGVAKGRTNSRKGFEGITFTGYGAELSRKAGRAAYDR